MVPNRPGSSMYHGSRLSRCFPFALYASSNAMRYFAPNRSSRFTVSTVAGSATEGTEGTEPCFRIVSTCACMSAYLGRRVRRFRWFRCPRGERDTAIPRPIVGHSLETPLGHGFTETPLSGIVLAGAIAPCAEGCVEVPGLHLALLESDAFVG